MHILQREKEEKIGEEGKEMVRRQSVN